jgi:hypothetical protein
MSSHRAEKPSFAELLRYVGGRAAERGSLRARARGEERRAALRAYVFAYTRRLLVWVIASACFVLIGGPDVPTDTAPRTVSAFVGKADINREPTDVR